MKNGAWGDHITMQAISDMFSVIINVLSSQYSMYSVTPSNNSAAKEVFVGLILQYHYVGLDKIPEQPVQPEPVASNDTMPEQLVQTVSTSDNELDDATIEEGDEHRRQLQILKLRQTQTNCHMVVVHLAVIDQES